MATKRGPQKAPTMVKKHVRFKELELLLADQAAQILGVSFNELVRQGTQMLALRVLSREPKVREEESGTSARKEAPQAGAEGSYEKNRGV